MQTLGLDEETATAPEEGPAQPGFWKRQFQQERTKRQRIFDWAFGVIVPLVCVFADPVFFKGAGIGKGPLLGIAKPFAVIFSFLCIFMIVGWLVFGDRLRNVAAPLAGLFITGAIVAFCLGIVALPFTLFGLFFGIGLLGFTPFLSALVYLRNGLRVSDYSLTAFNTRTAVYTATLTALLSLSIPFVINCEINRYLDEMVRGDAATIYSHGRVLKYLSPLVNVDYLGGHYCDPNLSEEGKATAFVYQDISGESIERINFHICNDW